MIARDSIRFTLAWLLVLPVLSHTYAQTIYWTDIGTSKVQRLDVGAGAGVEDLLTIGQVFTPVDLVLDQAGGKMYWTEASPADFMIARANLDGSDVELLVTGLTSPSGIELDVAGGKMYWTDIGTGKIQRAGLDGSGVEDILTIGVVFTPIDLALDVPGNKIYWTESTLADFMIQRAELDGSNVELLVTDLVNPSGIALDVDAGKMYWTDVGTGKIQRANLDGSDVEDLVTTGVKQPVRIALDVQAGKIYWTEGSPADFMISRANLDGTGGEFLITGLTSPSGIALVLQAGPPTGACCFGNGFCTPQTQLDCEAVEGQVYLGDDTICVGDFTCPAVCWSCQCIDGLSGSGQSAIGCVAEESGCSVLCQAHGGLQSFQCDLGPCASIPTMSEWGMIVMTLLVLTAGTLLLVRARGQGVILCTIACKGRGGHPSEGARRNRGFLQDGGKKMRNSKTKAIFLSALGLTFASQAAAQTTFSHDNTIAITAVGGGEDLLTEGAPGPPVVAIGGASLGLVSGDHIDALSFGDDTPLMTEHQIVFSVDANSIGLGFVGNDVSFEFHVDSAPCAGSAPVPAAACGDIFLQTPDGGSHILAPLGFGYSPGSAAGGDECYAKWAGGNDVGAADDLNAFDYTAPADAAGIYFSLAPGSPTLATIAATPGDILYSDLSGAVPVIATLGGGAGLATAANLGIVLSDLDALSLVGTTGPVVGGGGVIATGAVGVAPANTGAVSTHLLEFSVTRGGGAVGFAADVLVRVGAGVAGVFVPAEEGLGLAIVDEDELNALEVISTVRIPTVSEWGMVVMTLLLLAVGTLLMRRQPARA